MPRVAIIGAGFGGLCMGIRLRRAGISSFTIFERADGVGGTWAANTYPGAECDIPSALYSYSFENFDWPNKWSHQPVILSYLQHCARKYGLGPHLRLGHTVTQARWDPDDAGWDIEVTTPAGDTLRERFDMVVSATGQLSRPKRPDIDGLDSFSGPLFHSAEWDHSVDLVGKRVASIGSGASAVQYVPAIADAGADVTVFQRTPNWIVPKRDRDYSEFEKTLIRHSRLARNVRRFWIWSLADTIGFEMVKGRSRVRERGQRAVVAAIRAAVADPETAAELIPDYPMGAKRVLFSDDYYRAIGEHGIDIVTDPIRRVTPTGIVTVGPDGAETDHDLDVIVLGTGFHTQDFLTPMTVLGAEGTSLNDRWAERPEAYLGIATSGFPNLFFLYGPNTNLGHNSIVVMIEAQVRYLLSLIDRMERAGLAAVDVRSEVQDRYNAELDRRLAESAWVLVDDSWYLQGGHVTNNWVGRTAEYRRRTWHANLADYHHIPA